MQVSSDSLYTLRWHLTQDPPQVEDAVDLLTSILGVPLPGVTVPAVPDESPAPVPAEDTGRGLRLLRCPFAVTRGLPAAKTRGNYRKDYPEGAVVHFTAGSHKQKVEDAIADMVARGFCYFLIARDGTVYQNFPLDEWGYHAGESAWKGLPGTVSNEMVGIEVMASGKLDANRSPWYDHTFHFPESETRWTDGNDQQERGLYHIYTPEQEAALERLLRWLENNNPNVFKFENVRGHDEVSGPRGIGRQRKNDPGAALSMTMDQFRAKLKGKGNE
jgi:N-acetylmuramoyl-L-alanine amidase